MITTPDPPSHCSCCHPWWLGGLVCLWRVLCLLWSGRCAEVWKKVWQPKTSEWRRTLPRGWLQAWTLQHPLLPRCALSSDWFDKWEFFQECEYKYQWKVFIGFRINLISCNWVWPLIGFSNNYTRCICLAIISSFIHSIYSQFIVCGQHSWGPLCTVVWPYTILPVLPCVQSMVGGQSGLMEHVPRPVTMEWGQGTGRVMDHTVEDVSAGALRRWQWSAMRDLAKVYLCEVDVAPHTNIYTSVITLFCVIMQRIIMSVSSDFITIKWIWCTCCCPLLTAQPKTVSQLLSLYYHCFASLCRLSSPCPTRRSPVSRWRQCNWDWPWPWAVLHLWQRVQFRI